MPRILTGIQSSGQPHLGNILGAIEPALKMAAESSEPAYFFIADLHALTTIRNAETLRKNTWEVAAAWLACGLDSSKDVFYRQSRLPEVTELTWYLNCFAPYPMLANAHSFKDKSENLSLVTSGLFTYPVLMAADIIGYDAEIVPVGKDQVQHLEITRDIAGSFNHLMGETFIIPQASVNESLKTIPGTDGRKMSKSYNNYINIFADEKSLRKSCMSIQTDSTPLEAPKNPDTCNVFALYKVVASLEDIEELRQKYLGGGMGYGHAKELLFQTLLKRFENQRKTYQTLVENPHIVEEKLLAGEEKARTVIQKVLDRVRKALGTR